MTLKAGQIAKDPEKTGMMIFISKQAQILKKEMVWYLFLAPTVVTILFLTFYPLAKTFVLSLYMSRNGGLENYVGFFNYLTILTDQNFWNALYNTVHMGFFSLAVNIPVSFILACTINDAKYGKNLYKTLYFLPNVTSIVAVTLIFRFVFYPSDAGIVNYILSGLGIKPLGWLNDPNYSKWVVIIMGLWHGIGYNVIIWLAGLQAIPGELYEAANVDGAKRLQKWWFITIPLSRPIFVFMLIMGTMGSLRRFADVWTIGGSTGSPLRSLQTIVSYFYDVGMRGGQYGIGAAASVVIFLLIMIVTTTNLVVTKKKD